jgi:hypothetical protein
MQQASLLLSVPLPASASYQIFTGFGWMTYLYGPYAYTLDIEVVAWPIQMQLVCLKIVLSFGLKTRWLKIEVYSTREND